MSVQGRKGMKNRVLKSRQVHQTLPRRRMEDGMNEREGEPEREEEGTKKKKERKFRHHQLIDIDPPSFESICLSLSLSLPLVLVGHVLSFTFLTSLPSCSHAYLAQMTTHSQLLHVLLLHSAYVNAMSSLLLVSWEPTDDQPLTFDPCVQDTLLHSLVHFTTSNSPSTKKHTHTQDEK